MFFNPISVLILLLLLL